MTEAASFDLGKACLEGNTNLILRYLDNSDDASNVINKPDKDKRTPLQWACSMGSVEVVRALCDKGADVELKDESGWTAVMIASSAGRSDIVEELLYRGANPMAENPRGQTALHYAASKGHLEVARSLLVNSKGGADVNARDKAKQCPM